MKKAVTLIPPAIVVASFITGLFFYPRLPERIVSHWNMYGNADGFMPKAPGTFFMPAITLVFLFLVRLLPLVDPYAGNYGRFRANMDRFIATLFVFLYYIYTLTLLWNAGFRFNFTKLIVPAFSVLFLSIGLLVEKAKKNWFVGIRTPWTLADDKVWDKTHKLAARLYKVSAVITLLGLFYERLAFYLLVVPVVATSVFAFFYSLWEYLNLHRGPKRE